MSKTISFEKFKEVEIRIGKVLSCEKVEGADKLLKLQVDFGPAEQGSGERTMMRQVISGIAQSFEPQDLIGRTFPFVVNLEYRKIRGEESQGMLLATGTGWEDIVLLEPTGKVDPGTEVV